MFLTHLLFLTTIILQRLWPGGGGREGRASQWWGLDRQLGRPWPGSTKSGIKGERGPPDNQKRRRRQRQEQLSRALSPQICPPFIPITI